MYKQRLHRELKKMFGINKREENFYGNFTTSWMKAGGLISQATARRLLERSKGRINQMIKEGKLKEYVIEGVSYLSFAEVIEKAEKIQTKLARDKAVEELAKLGLGDAINAGLMAQFDEVMKYDPSDDTE